MKYRGYDFGTSLSKIEQDERLLGNKQFGSLEATDETTFIHDGADSLAGHKLFYKYFFDENDQLVGGVSYLLFDEQSEEDVVFDAIGFLVEQLGGAYIFGINGKQETIHIPDLNNETYDMYRELLIQWEFDDGAVVASINKDGHYVSITYQ